MNIRVLSGAFIINESNFLMMKRAENRAIAPGVWSGVGGHVEPHEINNPKITCLREIYEETGIEEKDIKDLSLRYIVLRKDNSEITLIYFFIGFAQTRYYKDKTMEGKLFWVDKYGLLGKPMSFEVRNVAEHYLKEGYKSNEINVGTISVIENKPIINCHSLDGWEGLMSVQKEG